MANCMAHFCVFENESESGDPVVAVETPSRGGTIAAINIELQCNMYCLSLLSLRFWRVQYMGGVMT
jgi:hypothetical protein